MPLSTNKLLTTISLKNNKLNVEVKKNSEKKKFLMPPLHSNLPKKSSMDALPNKPEPRLI
jgi:hypothetical protein